MKALAFISALALLGFSSCSFILRKALHLNHPRVESRESILALVERTGLASDTHYMLKGGADSASRSRSLLLGMKRAFLIFDSLGYPLSYTAVPGCRGNSEKHAFSSDSFQRSSKDTLMLSERLTAGTLLRAAGMGIESSSYTILIYWSRFYGGRKHLEKQYFLVQEIRARSLRPLSVIWLNVDPNEEWGLEKGKKLPLEFRYKGGGYASLGFKE